jgi:phytoene dehydrogenase-like protein
MELVSLLQRGLGWLADDTRQRLRPTLLADLFRPVAAHLRGASDRLRLFVDAQLLIAAQTTSHEANALFGAAALDLPRRGTVNPMGGMGAIAQTLVEAIRRHGGTVLTRQEVARIVMERGRPVAVETKRRESFPADLLVANLTPWNIAGLLAESAPPRLKRLPPVEQAGWGAFTTYVGVDGSLVPNDFTLHQQIVTGRPLGEGNSVFLSMSPDWDESRAPQGMRAVTLSTHTEMAPWWRMFEQDRQVYEARKAAYARRLIEVADSALPGLAEAAQLVLPGTPVTFQRFTRRQQGWVGGFPQTSLFKAWGPRLAPGLWMVGDSIFPGQSIAAAALGGLRVAQLVLHRSTRPALATMPQLTSLAAGRESG